MSVDARKQAVRRTAIQVGMAAVGMFLFGYALVPLYDVLCEVTGLNGKTGRAEAAAGPIDQTRTVTVEFMGQAATGLPWEFRPMTRSMEVHPGQVMTVQYEARNRADEAIVGQAVPSVAPGRAAAHFKKIECFCFTQQALKAGESRVMPVQFVVDAGLDPEVKTITLSYTFFNTDKISAERHGARGKDSTEHAAHDHAHHAGG